MQLKIYDYAGTNITDVAKSIDLKLAPGIMIKLSEMKHYYADRTYARFRAE